MSGLTHFDDKGDAHMVDISDKAVTDRIARATGRVKMSPQTLDIIVKGLAQKGDVLAVAQLAGIMGCKQTSNLIPLCHPLPISKVAVELTAEPATSSVVITSTVKTTGQTGIEMEALTAVSIAALTVYDMLKAVDRAMEITDIKVVLKDGGKSGRYEATT
ncbi:MAG: cyclic pyranopterin monophosphate synthase MoaC [Rhodobacterales bacterium]|jgi:cyclic pyranopterin monophosphate synthase|nr:cyclic pyranopterin monophosphate synthase MoaC [Pseudomonadota bacterium]MDA1285333.1 cyclic pyranopterin monophosphate synthase MoaC [Pseudomonadota bacterium]NQW14815.1 cyclic pyranopterin monophosphate synthase MoaC [Rhodobacter sp.]